VLCRVIYPEDKQYDTLTCSCCELSYTNKEYKILKDADRLAYFFSDEYGYFCHLCLMEYIKTNKESGENTPIIVKTKKGEIKLNEC